jgi:alpha-tubulin suppressor-like RCC1 family protein
MSRPAYAAGSQVPATVADFALTTISTGESHACGLRPEGFAYCWGKNWFGKLGNFDGSFTSSSRPVRVASVDLDGDFIRETHLRFSGISAGGEHTCALTLAGEAYCWGDNQHAQIGNGGDTGVATLPIRVDTTETFTSIATGQFHSCALTADGRAFCWGDGLTGQLGVETFETCTFSGFCIKRPRQVASGARFTQIAIGESHSCALDLQGAAYCWGINSTGALGLGFTSFRVLTPTPIVAAIFGEHPNRWSEIAAGWRVTCAAGQAEPPALPAGRGVYCWGGAVQAPLLGRVFTIGGEFSLTTRSPVPVSVEVFGDVFVSTIGLRFLVSSQGWLVGGGISLLGGFTCALDAAGDMWCWGANEKGQFGGSTTQANCESLYAVACTLWPVKSLVLPSFSRISAGGQYMCGLSTTGTAWCWGENSFGQLGNGTFDARSTPSRVLPPVGEDTSPPLISVDFQPAMPDGGSGWYVSPVHVIVNANDGPGGSGVAETRCRIFAAGAAPALFDGLPPECPFGGAGATVADDGIYEIAAGSRDAAGNTGTPLVRVAFRVDRTPPTVSCHLPEPVFVLNTANAIVTGASIDALSGPASRDLFAAADTTSLGQKTTTLTAADLAGNRAGASCAYSVVPDVSFDGGFQGPLNEAFVNVVNAGRTIPLVWRLIDSNGPVTTLASVTVTTQPFDCHSGVVDGATENVALRGPGLQNLGDGYYQWNWKSPSGYGRSCRMLTLEVGHGVRQSIRFRFR